MFVCFLLNTNIEEKRTGAENRGEETAGEESRREERKLKKREYQNALQITTLIF